MGIDTNNKKHHYTYSTLRIISVIQMHSIIKKKILDHLDEVDCKTKNLFCDIICEVTKCLISTKFGIFPQIQ